MQVLTMKQMTAASGGNSVSDAPDRASLMPYSSANQSCPAPRPLEREPGLQQVMPGALSDGFALVVTVVGSYLESVSKK